MLNDERVLIFSGGNLGLWALKELHTEDFVIGVDGGALFLVNNNIKADYVVGDFDSVTLEEFQIIKQSCKNVAKYHQNKDYTDTELAFNFALARKPREIVMLGVTGSRFDHSFANIQLLYKGLQKKIPCKIIDENNEIRLIDKPEVIKKDNYTNVSLLPFSLEVTGVTLKGFRYPLHNKILGVGETIGISNILEDHEGEISLTSGVLLVIKSRD